MSKQRPRQITVCEREKLFCETCQKFVYGICITQEWNDHLSHSKIVHPEANYKRFYSCPYCRQWVMCRHGTYEPVSKVIPTQSLRNGRNYTFRLVVSIGEEFRLKRNEIATCLGFSHYKEIKKCNDVEQLRKAYKLGIRLRNELRRMDGIREM